MDKTTAMLEPENASGGGLYVPGKDRIVFRPPERKSLLGKYLINMYMFLFKKTKFKSLMKELLVIHNALLAQLGMWVFVNDLTFVCINFKKFMG